MTDPAYNRIDIRANMDAGVVIQPWPSRAAWLASRVDSIGASEAAMALGVSPYGTAWQLWERKRAPAAEKRADVLQRGHRWEPAVLAEYADESGYTVLDPGKACGGTSGQVVTLYRRELPWLRETPDAFAVDRAGGLGQVEAKTALRAHEWAPEPGVVIDRWDDAHAELVPPHYAIQGYVQLIVTGLPWVDLCALVPRYGWLSVRWVRLQRDPETQTQITDALTEWWERHVVDGEPPPLDGSEPCNRYLAQKFPSPSGKEKPTRGATREEIALMIELAELKARVKRDEERAAELRNQLLERAKGERLSIGAAYGQPQNNAGRTVVDMDALRSEAPELVAKHERKSAPFASFNLYRFKELLAVKARMDAEEGDR